MTPQASMVTSVEGRPRKVNTCSEADNGKTKSVQIIHGAQHRRRRYIGKQAG